MNEMPNLRHRFTKAERELRAARPFGYGPRKFYESSQLMKKTIVDDSSKKKPDASAPPAPEELPVDPEEAKKLKKIYIAMTSDRGKSVST